jgi:ATP-binding cassette subfamily G (WHITE) protein 2 (SNQ2)
MPRTAAEFASYFNRSPIAQLNRDDMAMYKEAFVGNHERADAYRKSALAEHARHTRKKSYVTVSVIHIGFLHLLSVARTRSPYLCKLEQL